MFDNVSSINNTTHILNMIAQKQKVLGENLANVDTPGYTRKDYDFSSHLSSANSASLETRLAKKFGNSDFADINTGETVNSAFEMMELQKNSMMYNMATRQMSSIITQMKTAINVGK